MSSDPLQSVVQQTRTLLSWRSAAPRVWSTDLESWPTPPGRELSAPSWRT